MAEDKRISELSPIPTVTPGALFPVVDEITGETMHARFDQMATTVDLDDYALKTYVDAQDIATLDDAKDYADLQDVTNLNAAKAYADGLVVGLWDDRGNFNASVNAYPSTGGSGTAGAIKKGDIWTVSVAGILPSSQSVEIGDTVRALVDTPGNTQANWSIQQNNIGYTAENSANKTNVIAGNETNTVLYASLKGVVDYLVGMTWLTSTIFGAWIVGNTAKTTPVGGDSILISDLSDSNKTKKTTLTELWTNYLRAFVFAISLTTNRILKWDGSKLIDGSLSDASGIVSHDISGNNARTTISSSSNSTEYSMFSTTNIMRFGTYAGSVFGSLTSVSAGITIDTIGSAFSRLRSGGSDGRQVYVDNTMNYYANTTHQFVNQAGTNVASITANGVVIGSSTIDASAQLHSQATNKGSLARNRVTTSQKTSISSPANGLQVYDTDLATDSSYTTRSSINAWIDSKIKFSELFDPFLIDQQIAPSGTVYVARFKPKSDMIITAIEFIVTSFTSSETYYVGVYNTALTSKLTDGSASITSSGEKQISVTPIKLTGATTYYLVIKDNNGGTLSVGASTSYANTLICSSKFIGAGALPADLTSGGSPTADTKAPYLGVISL